MPRWLRTLYSLYLKLFKRKMCFERERKRKRKGGKTERGTRMKRGRSEREIS